MKISKSTWIGGPLFNAVQTAFTQRGYTSPQPDTPGGSGAYAMNIVSQYFGRLSEREVLEIINEAGDNRELPRRYQTSGVKGATDD